jgi:hypothetical protein
VCKICGENFKSITNTHLKEKHNMSQIDYKLKYGQTIISNKSKEKLFNNYNKFLKDTPNIKTSKLEETIINNIPINFKQSDRTILNGKEIDLLFNNTGIEIHGNLFHTEIFGKKPIQYHLNKSKLAKEKNINLYHIFEDEILFKTDIVINKLKHIFNIKENKQIIHARKCNITEISNHKHKSNFLEKNHIQGNDKASIVITATYENKIIAIMCFNNKRNMNKSNDHNQNTYELTRFATDNNSIITGIASRLLKYFIINYYPKKIISFADRRWTPNSENNLYTNLGFKLTKTLRPEYFYYNPKIDRHKRFHKFGFGKSSLKRKYPEIYDDNKTEWEMMQELGFDRIWDCGKYKYELDL